MYLSTYLHDITENENRLMRTSNPCSNKFSCLEFINCSSLIEEKLSNTIELHVFLSSLFFYELLSNDMPSKYPHPHYNSLLK